jgi:hypothetical protein
MLKKRPAGDKIVENLNYDVGEYLYSCEIRKLGINSIDPDHKIFR